jgi:hypothetical protein
VILDRNILVCYNTNNYVSDDRKDGKQPVVIEEVPDWRRTAKNVLQSAEAEKLSAELQAVPELAVSRLARRLVAVGACRGGLGAERPYGFQIGEQGNVRYIEAKPIMEGVNAGGTSLYLWQYVNGEWEKQGAAVTRPEEMKIGKKISLVKRDNGVSETEWLRVITQALDVASAELQNG